MSVDPKSPLEPREDEEPEPQPYEAPRVQSVKLSEEAAEALT